MTEEKIKADEIAPAGAARIAELEIQVERLKRENRALQGKGKMLTTSAIEAPPTISPRPNRMISTTIPRPHSAGRLLQTHGLPAPETPEQAAQRILARVKGDRISVVTKKEKA